MSLDDLLCTATGRPGAFAPPDEDHALLIAHGGIDLFLQRGGSEGVAPGALHHLLRAGPGDLLPGAGADDLPAGHVLVAVPLPESRWVELPTEVLEAAVDPGVLLSLLVRWSAAFVAGLPDLPPPPRSATTLMPGAVMRASPDDIIVAEPGLAWVRADSGRFRLADCPIDFDEREGLIVVPGALWLQCAEAGALQLLDGQVPASPVLWPSLARLQGRILAARAERIVMEGRRAADRNAARAERSRLVAGRALRQLADVEKAGAEVDPTGPGNDCFATCRLLSDYTGIRFSAPVAAEYGSIRNDPVGAIAAASRVRARRVVLKGEWWRTDSGALLGRREDDSRWVALVPGRRGYRARHPGDVAWQPVDESLAREIQPFAHSFYRSLPERPLGIRDVARFAAFGRGADLLRVVGLGVMGGILGMAMPVATATLVDSLIPGADRVGLWQLTAALLTAAMAAACLDVARSIAVLRLETRMDNDLQAAVWDRVLRLPATFFREHSAGDLAQRIHGVNQIRAALSGRAMRALLDGIFSIFSLGLLVVYSPRLAAVACGFLALALMFSGIVGVQRLRTQRQLATIGGALSAQVFQYLQSIARLRASATEAPAFARWAARFADYRRLRLRTEHWVNVEHTFLSGYTTIATAGLFAVMAGGLTAEADTRVSTGQFIAFTAAFGTFFKGMLSVVETVIELLALVPVYERARPVLQAVPEVRGGQLHPGEITGALDVSELRFAYPGGPEILRGVSFSVPAGSFIAVVGPSGSGKSTLLRMLLGFEGPTAGSVYYDGQDLQTLDIEALRRQLGVVLQNGKLIPGDVFANIAGTGELGIEDAWEAARMVGLDADLEAMPMGMHTAVGEGVATLSGGQRQRILIARAVAHRPRILLFDEATSALDNHTQGVVTASLDRLKSTRIVIAHRLSTVIGADRILVMDRGEIVQQGTYAELAAAPGLFAELVRRQSD